VAEGAVYPPCLRNSSSGPFRGVFLMGSLFPLSRFIEQRVDPKGELGAGGSVATSAWDFCRLLGPSSIWIAGLDLGYPGLKTHFRGALFEDRALAGTNRFAPLETWSVKALRDGRPFYAKSLEGGRVLTDRRLSLYASWFENRFASFPLPRTSSISGGGLAIRGLAQGTVEELLALPVRESEIRGLLNDGVARILRDFSDEAEKRAAAYEKAFASLMAGLERIRGVAEEAARQAEEGLRLLEAGRAPDAETKSRLFAALDAADTAIMSSEVRETAGFLLPDIETLAGDDEPPNLGHDALYTHLSFSARFYRALAETSGYHLKLFK
jgi:hypothetical protein